MIKIISKQKYENLLDRIDELTLDLEDMTEQYEKAQHNSEVFHKDNKEKDEIIKLKDEMINKLANQLLDYEQEKLKKTKK